jgi:hypothetical protein
MSFNDGTDIFHQATSFAPSYLQPTYFWMTLVLLLLFSYGPFISNRGRKLPGIPIAGARSVLEPEIVTRYRSVTQAWAVVDDGYRKVGCPRSIYFPTNAPFSRVAGKTFSWDISSLTYSADLSRSDIHLSYDCKSSRTRSSPCSDQILR